MSKTSSTRWNNATFEAAYKFYCDKDLEGAHEALPDTLATVEVFSRNSFVTNRRQ